MKICFVQILVFLYIFLFLYIYIYVFFIYKRGKSKLSVNRGWARNFFFCRLGLCQMSNNLPMSPQRLNMRMFNVHKISSNENNAKVK